MKSEKGIISSSQLMFLIIGLIEASTLTAAFISGITKQDTWVVLLAGFTITLLLLLVYTTLSKRFPGKNLIEINGEIYGNYFGKIMSILYIYYFWFIIPANLRFIVDFFSTYLFPETDIMLFAIFTIIICMYTVKKGIEVIARAGFILTIIAIIVSIFITIVTIKDIQLSNFLPFFQVNLKEFVQGTNLMISIPFGEIVVFLMIFPYVNDINEVKKSSFWGLIIGGIFFLSVIFRNTSILGNIESIHVLSSYQVARMINIGEVIERTEVLVAVVLLFNLFLKICIFYYATVLAMAQFFKLRSYKPLVIPVGVISVIISMTMYSATVDQVYSSSIYSVFVIPFVIIFPVISLIIAEIRKLN